MIAFNNLSLGCKYKAAQDANSAHVVVTLAKSKLTKQQKKAGKKEYFTINHYGDVATTDDKFQSDSLNGESSAIEDLRRKELFFAGIFLPGDYSNPTPEQKEMIVLHELIYAAGMDEHDSQGIMYDSFAVDGKKVIEYLHEKTPRQCPSPIRWNDEMQGAIGLDARCQRRRHQSGRCL